MYVAQGEAFPNVVNPGSISKKNKEGKWYHPQLKIDRLVWRDSTALFAFDEREDRRPKAFRQVQTMRSLVSLPQRYICTAYALANEKANPLLWRRERLNVPFSLLSDSNTVAYLEKGMSLADRGAQILNGAARMFMKEYLPEYSQDVSDKVASLGASQTYWDRMEGQYHQFLHDLETPENALKVWECAIKSTARESLNVCLDGRYRGSTRSYRAWSIASDYLNAQLANLHE
jgi:CRISPR system Cascade subunit CasA